MKTIRGVLAHKPFRFVALALLGAVTLGTSLAMASPSNDSVAQMMADDHGFFPPKWWMGLIGSLLYFTLALAMYPLAYKVIDWITPGVLSGQLLGTLNGVAHTPDGKPNVALGVVVGGMFLGMSIIIAAAIH